MKHNVNVRIFQKFLKSQNFKKVRQKGSHAIYSNNEKTNSLTIEKNSKSYSQGHLKKILKDFNIKENELITFLYKK